MIMAKKYFYRARNLSGKLVSGNVRAENRDQAIALLKGQKLFVFKIKVSLPSGLMIPDALWKKRVSTKELAVVCRQFAVMTRAGVPILQSLNIIISQCDNKTMKETLKKVVKDLEGGISLADTVKSHPSVFPLIFTSMIEAGEISGALDDVLESLAKNFENEHDLKEKVKSAMIYPAIVSVVAVLAVVALMVFIVPKFVTILDNMEAPLPLTTQLIIAASVLMKRYWSIVLLLVAGVVFGYKYAIRTSRGAKVKDRVVINLPVYGPLVRKIIISRFCRSLGALLKSGVPVLQSLAVVKNIAGNYEVVKGIEDAEKSIEEGHSISLPLQKSGIFPPMVTRMMAIGEETGSMDMILEEIAGFYEKEVENLVVRLSSMIEPVLIIGLGGVVGFIILSIMLPMFSVFNIID